MKSQFLGLDRRQRQICPFCIAELMVATAVTAAQIDGSVRVLPDTRLSPSVTLTIGMAGESASVQRRLDWSA
jgi:hypothetical protein